MSMKYYGVFVDGKLTNGWDGYGPVPDIRRRNDALRLAQDFFNKKIFEICEVRITRVRKAKKASKKASKK